MRLGRKNLRLLLDTEPAGDLLTLPVARVVRDGSGHFVYDPHFIPPVLQISASERLMTAGAAADRNPGRKERRASAAAGAAAKVGAEFSTREIANFWLLHAVNSALAPLRHLLVAKRGHPEELFVEMSRLAGALCTFALDSHPRDAAALRSPEPGRVLRRAGPPHSHAPGNHRPHQLHLDSAAAAGRLLLGRRDYRPALPRPFAMGVRAFARTWAKRS